MDILGAQINIFIDLDIIDNFDKSNKGIDSSKHNVEFSMDVLREIWKMNVILAIIEDSTTLGEICVVNADLTLIHSCTEKMLKMSNHKCN